MAGGTQQQMGLMGLAVASLTRARERVPEPADLSGPEWDA